MSKACPQAVPETGSRHRITVEVPWASGKALTKFQEKYLEATAKDDIEELWCGGEARLVNVTCEIVADKLAEAA